MDILVGTTNKSKLRFIEDILKGLDVKIKTPDDYMIISSINESGKTPLENAMIKVNEYKKYCDCVICQDAGLFISSLDLLDYRQPNTHIRRVNGKELTDDEMIDYYKELVKSLGGKVYCYYLSAFAIYNNGLIDGYMDQEECLKQGFYMVDKPHQARHIGWPLDSISISLKSGKYFVEEDLCEEDEIFNTYLENVRHFFIEKFDLKPIKASL